MRLYYKLTWRCGDESRTDGIIEIEWVGVGPTAGPNGVASIGDRTSEELRSTAEEWVRWGHDTTHRECPECRGECEICGGGLTHTPSTHYAFIPRLFQYLATSNGALAYEIKIERVLDQSPEWHVPFPV